MWRKAIIVPFLEPEKNHFKIDSYIDPYFLHQIYVKHSNELLRNTCYNF